MKLCEGCVSLVGLTWRPAPGEQIWDQSWTPWTGFCWPEPVQVSSLTHTHTSAVFHVSWEFPAMTPTCNYKEVALRHKLEGFKFQLRDESSTSRGVSAHSGPETLTGFPFVLTADTNVRAALHFSGLISCCSWTSSRDQSLTWPSNLLPMKSHHRHGESALCVDMTSCLLIS